MTYRFRVGLRPQWLLVDEGGEVSLHELLALLAAIDATGHIAGACRACGLSYRHGWGILRRFEESFGTPLLITRRRRGTELSLFAQRLLWANRRIEARLTPTLESLASELQEDLQRLLPETTPHLRLHASHGFAVEALMQHMSHRPPGMELRYRTAGEALASLLRRECDLAGFQLPLGEYQRPILQYYAQWLDPDQHMLVHLAVRHTGLFTTAGNPKNLSGIADLARPDVRFVNRQADSSTHRLIGLMLARAGIKPEQVQGYDTTEFTHMAVAAHIASGMADAGVGVQTAAVRFGLHFIPLVRERYFFAFHRAMLEHPSMQALLAVLRSPEYLAYLEQLVGYEAGETGKVQTLREAFGTDGGGRSTWL